MAFKLYSDGSVDHPFISCDVCSEKITDVWSAKATGSPQAGQTVGVTVHHPSCAATGAITMSLIEFLRMFVVKNRIGDVGSDGQVETAHVPYPEGRGFEV